MTARFVIHGGGKRGDGKCYQFVRYLRRRVFRPRVAQSTLSFRAQRGTSFHSKAPCHSALDAESQTN